MGADLVKTIVLLKHFYKYFGFALLLASACGKDEYKPADIGHNYFPLKTGSYRIYVVNEIRYSEIAAPEISSYQLKEQVTDSFPDGGNGNYTYVIHRSTRQDAGGQWKPLSTWSARVTNLELMVNEGNTSFVKLTFPVRKGHAWN